MKSVLITGATSGIGKALVKQYSDQGFKVIACGRSEDKLNLLSASTQNVTTLCFDINDEKHMQTAMQSVGQVDLVILNAGDCEYIEDVMHFDADLFKRIITTNLISVGYLVQALIGKISQGGRLAFVSSSVTHLPFPKAQAYGASKAGLDYLAQSLALDLAPHNIHVSLIQPGFVKTPLTDKNTFNMPFLMSSEQAAKLIIRGLHQGRSLIAFPSRLIYLLKLFRTMPRRIWTTVISGASV